MIEPLEHIGNMVTAIFMIILCIKSSSRMLPLLIASGAIISVVLWELNLDIAVYYALNADVAMFLAYYSIVKIDKPESIVYGALMFIQSIICLTLIIDITPEANEFMQNILVIYNNVIYLIIICIGIIASDSDNFLTRLYYRYARNTG